jgi:hypothetical protein
MGAISTTNLGAAIETLNVPTDVESRVPVIERKRNPETVNDEPAVLDWDNIVHKNVRTKDNEPIGNVAAVTSGSVVVTSIGARDEYYIPTYVEKYDGAELFESSTRSIKWLQDLSLIKKKMGLRVFFTLIYTNSKESKSEWIKNETATKSAIVVRQQ